MGNQELHDYFISYVAFKDVCHSYCLPHHLNISLLVIKSTIMGYMKASLLCEQRKRDMDNFIKNSHEKSRLKLEMRLYNGSFLSLDKQSLQEY
ncbi:hypothetical protein H5410_062509 [Solanum commersonii]|uniref:Uncharacterized protein n=1 Tax=Solanum commersonii TaxID=4109 RepID=A0A9J5WBQ3_SOLCO|nr:hypothetical protein H5410_062509 [Solanum commersonii]